MIAAWDFRVFFKLASELASGLASAFEVYISLFV